GRGRLMRAPPAQPTRSRARAPSRSPRAGPARAWRPAPAGTARPTRDPRRPRRSESAPGRPRASRARRAAPAPLARAACSGGARARRRRAAAPRGRDRATRAAPPYARGGRPAGSGSPQRRRGAGAAPPPRGGVMGPLRPPLHTLEVVAQQAPVVLSVVEARERPAEPRRALRGRKGDREDADELPLEPVRLVDDEQAPLAELLGAPVPERREVREVGAEHGPGEGCGLRPRVGTLAHVPARPAAH